MENAAAGPANRDLAREVQRLWEQKAAFWDAEMAEGNLFHRRLNAPAMEALLAIKPGEHVLDVACGNGQFARRLAELGATVVACDFNEPFLERARARTKPTDPIVYQSVDATDSNQLLALGVGQFDAMVCSMGVMDMLEIGPLMRAAPKLLKPNGRFVVCVLHPCFNHVYASMVAESIDVDGQIVTRHALKLTDYLDTTPRLGAGMPGEPNPHYYFHRPLNQLLGPAFAAGLVLDGLLEPGFESADARDAILNWRNFPGIPPVFVYRLRPNPFNA